MDEEKHGINNLEERRNSIVHYFNSLKYVEWIASPLA